jgi:signal transduction histidine kinase
MPLTPGRLWRTRAPLHAPAPSASTVPEPRSCEGSHTAPPVQGLGCALADLSAQLIDQEVDVRLVLVEEVQAPRPVSELVLRVAAEALRNITMHATASKVTLTLRRLADLIEFVVADDGRGFNPADPDHGPEAGRLGLALLRDRAVGARGELTIDSSSGGGTTVRLFLPIEGPG